MRSNLAWMLSLLLAAVGAGPGREPPVLTLAPGELVLR